MFRRIVQKSLQAVFDDFLEDEPGSKGRVNVNVDSATIVLTNQRLKLGIINDLHLPLRLRAALVKRISIKNLKGFIAGDEQAQVEIDGVTFVMGLEEDGLGDPEAAAIADIMERGYREIWGAHSFGPEFLEAALKLRPQWRERKKKKNRIARKMIRHIRKRLLSSVELKITNFLVRLEQPLESTEGLCRAVGCMLPSLSLAGGEIMNASTDPCGPSPLSQLPGASASHGAAGSCVKVVKLDGFRVYCHDGTPSYVPVGRPADPKSLAASFEYRWQSENLTHDLIYPINARLRASVHQSECVSGAFHYRIDRIIVEVDKVVGVISAQKLHVISAFLNGMGSSVRRLRYRFLVPAGPSFPCRSVPPPQVTVPSGNILPRLLTSAEPSRPLCSSAKEAVKLGFGLRGWAAAMWRYALCCVVWEIRRSRGASALVRPSMVVGWDGDIQPGRNHRARYISAYMRILSEERQKQEKNGREIEGLDFDAEYGLQGRHNKGAKHDVTRLLVPELPGLFDEETWMIIRLEMCLCRDEIQFLRACARITAHLQCSAILPAGLSADSSKILKYMDSLRLRLLLDRLATLKTVKVSAKGMMSQEQKQQQMMREQQLRRLEEAGGFFSEDEEESEEDEEEEVEGEEEEVEEDESLVGSGDWGHSWRRLLLLPQIHVSVSSAGVDVVRGDGKTLTSLRWRQFAATLESASVPLVLWCQVSAGEIEVKEHITDASRVIFSTLNGKAVTLRVIYDPSTACRSILSKLPHLDEGSGSDLAQLRLHSIIGSFHLRFTADELALVGEVASTVEELAQAFLHLAAHNIMFGRIRITVRAPGQLDVFSACRRLFLPLATGGLSPNEGVRVIRSAWNFIPSNFEFRLRTGPVMFEAFDVSVGLLIDAVRRAVKKTKISGLQREQERSNLAAEFTYCANRLDICRNSTEFWVDTGAFKAKVTSTQDALEGIVTSLLALR